MRYRYSKEEILKKLDDTFTKYGELSKSELRKYCNNGRGICCSSDIIVQRFGSLDNAAKQINKKFKDITKWRWSKEKIIKSLIKFYNENNEQIFKSDLQKSDKLCDRATLFAYFNSWEEVENECNFKFSYSKYNKNWTKKEIIDNIKRYIQLNGVIKKIDLFLLHEKNIIPAYQNIIRIFGSIDNLAKDGNIEFQKTYRITKWTKEKVILRINDVYRKYGNLSISQLLNLPRSEICDRAVIFRFFDSWRDVEINTDIKFIKIKYKFGCHEKKILDIIEKHDNIQIERQYRVGRRLIDGYDKENNIAYEIDESHHKYYSVQDFLREQEIKSRLGCVFIRINDKEFLEKLGQKTLEDCRIEN